MQLGKIRREGLIIFINGVSSSGKSALAHALQDALKFINYRVSLDEYYCFLPPRIISQLIKADLKTNKDVLDWKSFWLGFNGLVVAIAKAGNIVIVDSICCSAILDITLNMFKEVTVVYIVTKCSLGELKKREIERGDRFIGLAESQYKAVHNDQVYDIEINTSSIDPKQAANKVIKWLNSVHKPKAFDQMRKSRILEMPG